MTTTIKYHHYRNARGKLFMTLCAQVDNDSQKCDAMGVSICSARDQFSRKIGRAIALSRLKKALLSKRDTLPIKHRDVPVIREALSFIVPAFKSIWRGKP